ncbi:polyketide cyclase [Brachybacterium ginsengisoli]|uniref:Polyketide cyclase n=1 Tax=Brachybacterium ginsengisoli TaxID=1331682 RepID=A0A291H1T8_9MICO|nr:SRPBCC family protein [Brachybacterium ginsengisoli]ATG56417.1 polyketide cyclase [Brachybacterium ginsengisoli]
MTSNQTHVTVTRTIDAPAKDLFALLTLPARHPEFDGSGTVRSAEDTERIDKSGEKFVMNMHREAMGGDYRTHNFVTAYDENKMIGWQPAPEGEDGSAPEGPLGWEWLYTLTPQGADATEVELTYDWSRITDQKLLQKVGFPAIPQEDLEQSLNLLAAAVTKG